jgi:hypothetical protein
MALQWCEGFSTLDTAHMLKKYESANINFISPNGGRNGRPYLRGAGLFKGLGPAFTAGTVFVGFAYRPTPTFSSAAGQILSVGQYLGILNTLDGLFQAIVLPDFTIGLFAGGSFITSSYLPIVTNVWQYFEFQIGVFASASVINPGTTTIWTRGEVRINSQLVSDPLLSHAGDTGFSVVLSPFAEAVVNSYNFLSTSGFELADIYITDNTGDFATYANDPRVDSTYAMANGPTQQWSGSFANINGFPPSDSPSSGISDTTEGDVSNFIFQPLSPSFTGTVHAIMLWAYAISDVGIDKVGAVLGDPFNFESGRQIIQNVTDFFYYGFGLDWNYDTGVDAPWTPANFNIEPIGYRYHAS